MFGQRDVNASDDGVITPSAPAVPDMGALSSNPMPAPTLASTPPAPAFSSASLDTTPSTTPAPATPPQPAPAPIPVSAPVLDDPAAADELVSMKQEALKHLQPLVGTLQQSPEEEFRTLMMMIQATDDRTMLKKALEAAKNIRDDKVRAQAMLDVINEINYFTQSGTAE
jgi:hypothetical protein